MSSLDFLTDVINPARVAAGQKPIRNNDFIAKIEDEIEDLNGYETFVSNESGRGGARTEQRYYNLNTDQMMLVGMRESKAVRKAVLAYVASCNCSALGRIGSNCTEA